MPLILDLIDSIGEKKIFMKIDLQWEYNNVRIKEKNKWKTEFLMLEGAFELMIMFFGLTNSPATFQTMMNDLLKDIIETGNVATFSNNVIVEIETEEGHDKIVEEALKRIIKNDLFVKLKKCVWKVREIGFLEVMIEPDSIRIEKKKVQEVVD